MAAVILYVTTADTDLQALAHVLAEAPAGLPPVRAVRCDDLGDPAAREAYRAALEEAQVVCLRLLSGRQSFPDPDLFEQTVRRCRERGVPLLALPGDLQPNPELEAATTVPAAVAAEAHRYLILGGVANLRHCLQFLSHHLLGQGPLPPPPEEQPWHGIYWPGCAGALDWEEYRARAWRPGRPTAGILFYRAHWLSRNLAFVDALIQALDAQGLNALPVFCFSLKDEVQGRGGLPEALTWFLEEGGQPRIDVLICTLSFSAGRLPLAGEVDAAWDATPFRRLGVPVLQAVIGMGERQEWEASDRGLGPLETAVNIAMPEFDGRIITVPISFKAAGDPDPTLGVPVRRYEPVPDRVERVAGLAARLARLRQKPNREKRIALLMTNYPAKNARIGNAVGLDTPNSVVEILKALAAAGYHVTDIPRDGDELVHRLIDRLSHDKDYLTPEQLAQAVGHVPAGQYGGWFAALPARVQEQVREAWGDPPGRFYLDGDRIAIAGLELGNVFVGLQPPRGFGDNPIAVYHAPDLVPTHHYIAYYRWLRDVWGADAIVHVGKHGTLEWLPGKGVGLSAACYPDLILQDVPHFYPYIINNPGEGSQAKRRAHATIVSHLIPVMMQADTYDDLARLEQLLDEYFHTEMLDPSKLPYLQQRIWELVVRAELHRDLGADAAEGPPGDFAAFLQEVDGYLCELKASQIRDGLHILGRPPQTREEWVNILYHLLKLPNGPVPSLPAAVAAAYGLDWRALHEHPGQRLPVPALPDGPGGLAALARAAGRPLYTHSDAIDAITQLTRRLLGRWLDLGGTAAAAPAAVAGCLAPLADATGAGASPGAAAALDTPAATDAAPSPGGTPAPAAAPSPTAQALRDAEAALAFAGDRLVPALRDTADEIRHLLDGLAGRFVPPGPSGAPTRGMAHILPTGRNFYSLDPRSLPSRAAWEVGKALGDRLLQKYLAEEGTYPESVGLVVWGTSAMRTQGDDIAEALWLLGVEPVWQAENRRVTGLRVIPLAELGRPRIDVTLRVSGFFRDAFPHLLHLLDEAVRTVAHLDEPPDQNFVRKHYLAEVAALVAEGQDPAQAQEVALYRVFGPKPGAYGSGILPLLDSRNWATDADIAAVYITWSGYAYTRQRYGTPAAAAFRRRLAGIQVAAKNQDNREHDIFDSDDYFQDHGGLIASVRALTGKSPRQFFGDSADPDRVRVRDLVDEARRVFRSRVVNPKWIAAVQRHGYKGAAELAATVDFIFGYSATAHVVEDWMYQQLAERYALDPAMQAFFRQVNPWALKDIAERLLEAMDRGLWRQPDPATRAALEQVVLAAEGYLEERGERP